MNFLISSPSPGRFFRGGGGFLLQDLPYKSMPLHKPYFGGKKSVMHFFVFGLLNLLFSSPVRVLISEDIALNRLYNDHCFIENTV